MAAVATGDLQSLMDVLAPDVVLITDGGGVKKAALNPIHGRREGAALPDRRSPPTTPTTAPSRCWSTATSACG